MRRCDREVSDIAEIKKFLAEQKIIRVGFCDGGEVYIVPVNYGHEYCGEKPVFYFHGAMAGRKYELAVRGADVVMALRIQRERQQSGLFPSVSEYSQFFGISQRRMELAAKDVIVMHPGPVNRGVELNSDVMDADNSFIDEQVTNGVAVRMALLYMMTRRA